MYFQFLLAFSKEIKGIQITTYPPPGTSEKFFLPPLLASLSQQLPQSPLLSKASGFPLCSNSHERTLRVPVWGTPLIASNRKLTNIGFSHKNTYCSCNQMPRNTWSQGMFRRQQCQESRLPHSSTLWNCIVMILASWSPHRCLNSRHQALACSISSRRDRAGTKEPFLKRLSFIQKEILPRCNPSSLLTSKTGSYGHTDLQGRLGNQVQLTLNNEGWGVLTPCAVKKLHITFDFPKT